MGKFTQHLFGFKKFRENPREALKEIPTPKIEERDLHHCNCCTPPTRTMITGLDSFGMPKFYCPKSQITYSFAYCRGVGSTYIAGN